MYGKKFPPFPHYNKASKVTERLILVIYSAPPNQWLSPDALLQGCLAPGWRQPSPRDGFMRPWKWSIWVQLFASGVNWIVRYDV